MFHSNHKKATSWKLKRMYLFPNRDTRFKLVNAIVGGLEGILAMGRGHRDNDAGFSNWDVAVEEK